jgi:hypothetical protein
MDRSTAYSLTVVIRNLLIYPGGLQGLHEGGETSLRIRLRPKKHFFLLVRPERKGEWKWGYLPASKETFFVLVRPERKGEWKWGYLPASKETFFVLVRPKKKERVEVGEGAGVVIFDHVGWEEGVETVSDMW